jgi:hypothetical protein
MNSKSPAWLRDRSGMTLMEVVMSAGIGMLLVATAGFLFLGQVRGYRDIGTQAKLQTAAKGAVQNMVTEIANTGACMANKRYKFIMKPAQLQFTYMDLKGRDCPESDTVLLSYAVHQGSMGDTLVQTVGCNSLATKTRGILKGEGDITLAFTYYDKNGVVTAVPANVKSIEFTIDVKSMSGGSLFVRDRNPKLRVELFN